MARATAIALLLVPTAAAATGSVCGDANGDGHIAASDALLVLRAAVGMRSCELCVCDTAGGGSVNAVDSLCTLKISVGLDCVTACPLCQAQNCSDDSGADCTTGRCGDGLLDVAAGEQCDDGGDSDTCDLDCSAAVCGDGRANPMAGEECDDGNELGGDGCEPDCTRTPLCGNDSLDEHEQCDDGNLADGDGCDARCRRETCAKVDGEVRCLACEAGSEPDAAFEACVCAPGFVHVDGDCVDVDECALGQAECEDISRCVNVPGSYSCSIDCSLAAFEAALASCGAPTGVITFACEDAVIPILPSDPIGARTVHCDDLVIDGLDRNVAFELDPPCFAMPTPQESCSVALAADGTCPCPDVENGPGFLVLAGSRNVVRNLTVRNFFEGIHTAGTGNTIEDSTFSRICDDAVGNIDDGVGNEFRRLLITQGCDKCAQNYGDTDLTDSDPRLRGHYNAIFTDVEFAGCKQPLRMTEGGRYLVERVSIAGSDDPLFSCDGPRFSAALGHDLVVEIRDSRITDCHRGLRLSGESQAVITRTQILSSGLRGVLVSGSARARLSRNVIVANGGAGSAEPGFGGVAVCGTAQVDLGGGNLSIDGVSSTSPGGNVLCSNFGPGGRRLEVQNLGTVSVAAAHNYWCTAESGLSNEGVVDTLPLLDTLP